MKTLMYILGLLLLLLNLGAVLPCQTATPTRADFEDLQPGSYRLLAYSAGDQGVVTVATESGTCLDVRTVDQTIHHNALGNRAVSVSEPLVIDFEGQDCWGVSMVLGADGFDAARHPQLTCYTDGLMMGGSSAWSEFGPEAEVAGHPGAAAGAFLHFFPYRGELPGYTPRPIDHCVLDPDGADVFMSTLQYKFDVVQPVAATPGKK